ncbi:hypothetical protein QQX98_000731 [Neonectria punicea]|uniref:Uncharacterized protein n=1 Tax=Neonectria punicea TaxID=979145 RepID=A0ABR1HSS5_9HYPO
MGSHRRRLVAVAAITTIIFLIFIASPTNITGNLIDVSEPPLTVKQVSIHSKNNAIGKSGDYRILTSIRDTMGFYNAINVEKTGLKIMNPTLLELPRGSRHDFLVIARMPHVDKEINGIKYELSRQVAMFANLTYNDAHRPVLMAGKWFKLLIQDSVGPEHHCKHQPHMDRYIGPEDMKLFWTRKGAPLLILTLQVNDENICQGMFLIDARASVPELVKAIGDQTRQMPPIQFEQLTGLRRQAPAGHEADPRYQRDKNWAPFQSPFSKDDDELSFIVEPGRVFRRTTSSEPVEDISVEPESVVEAPYPPWVESEETWHSTEKTCVHDIMMTNKNVHQSTPMLILTLCDRGTCEPQDGNTVMLGMVHRRYDTPSYPYTWYERRIVVYAATSPYKMMSVSKKLIYHGEADGRYIWTGKTTAS